MIVPFACPVPSRLPGDPKLSATLVVHLRLGSRVHAIYQRETIEERYFCNFEVNPSYRETLERGGLGIAGVGPDGEIRVVELPEHRFFVATLFLPQRSSRPDAPNPLVTAFVAAAQAFQSARFADRAPL